MTIRYRQFDTDNSIHDNSTQTIRYRQFDTNLIGYLLYTSDYECNYSNYCICFVNVILVFVV